MKPAIDPKLLNDPLFQRVMAEGLAMQDRFSAEPVYAKTGKGYLKSAGVEELKKIKAAQKKAMGGTAVRRKRPESI
jgi:hypothetical protein